MQYLLYFIRLLVAYENIFFVILYVLRMLPMPNPLGPVF